MKRQLRYLAGSVPVLPLLPLLYFQGKKIRSSVPALPEAKGVAGLTEVQSTKSIMMLTIGESTIAGVGVSSHREGFTGALAEAITETLGMGVQWRVYARSRYTAAKVRERLLPKIEESSVDLIVIGLGGNDAFHLNSPARWRKDVRELILVLRKKFPSSPIVFTNMPPIKAFPAFTPLIKWVVGNLMALLGAELKELTREMEQVYYNDREITLNDWIDRLGVAATPDQFLVTASIPRG